MEVGVTNKTANVLDSGVGVGEGCIAFSSII